MKQKDKDDRTNCNIFASIRRLTISLHRLTQLASASFRRLLEDCFADALATVSAMALCRADKAPGICVTACVTKALAVCHVALSIIPGSESPNARLELSMQTLVKLGVPFQMRGRLHVFACARFEGRRIDLQHAGGGKAPKPQGHEGNSRKFGSWLPVTNRQVMLRSGRGVARNRLVGRNINTMSSCRGTPV